MFSRLFLASCVTAGMLFCFSPGAHAAGTLLKPVYKTANSAARHAASDALIRNTPLRQKFGKLYPNRLHTAGNATSTPSGMQRFKVVTYKKIKGTKTPVAEVEQVTVRNTKKGWRAYKVSNKRVKINGKSNKPTTPGGEVFVGMEDWIEIYGAEGDHWEAPGRDGVFIPASDYQPGW